MNEWTHFFIKIYFSHFIRKGRCWLCVRGELETGTDCYILTQSSSDHSSTSFSSWLGCSTVNHWEPKALHLPRASCPQLELQLTPAVCGTWLYDCLTPTCFLWAYASSPNSTTSTGQGDIDQMHLFPPLIYTGASLDWRLGRGSICYTVR